MNADQYGRLVLLERNSKTQHEKTKEIEAGIPKFIDRVLAIEKRLEALEPKPVNTIHATLVPGKFNPYDTKYPYAGMNHMFRYRPQNPQDSDFTISNASQAFQALICRPRQNNGQSLMVMCFNDWDNTWFNKTNKVVTNWSTLDTEFDPMLMDPWWVVEDKKQLAGYGTSTFEYTWVFWQGTSATATENPWSNTCAGKQLQAMRQIDPNVEPMEYGFLGIRGEDPCFHTLMEIFTEEGKQVQKWVSTLSFEITGDRPYKDISQPLNKSGTTQSLCIFLYISRSESNCLPKTQDFMVPKPVPPPPESRQDKLRTVVQNLITEQEEERKKKKKDGKRKLPDQTAESAGEALSRDSLPEIKKPKPTDE